MAGVLALVLSQLSLSENLQHRKFATVLTHVSIGLIFVALFCDVVKMNFGLDPAIQVAKSKDGSL